MKKEDSEEWKEDPAIKYKDGIYIFMPKKDEQASLQYSQLKDIKVIQTDSVAEFLLTYEDNLPTPARAVVRIRLEANNDKFINYEVVLN